MSYNADCSSLMVWTNAKKDVKKDKDATEAINPFLKEDKVRFRKSRIFHFAHLKKSTDSEGFTDLVAAIAYRLIKKHLTAPV